MFFDFQYAGSGSDGLIIFPDFPFAAIPIPAANLMDTVFILGQQSSPPSLPGTIDPGN